MTRTKEYRSPEWWVSLFDMGGEVVGHLDHLSWSGANEAGVAERILWFRVTGVPADAIPDAMNAMETDSLLPILGSSIEKITIAGDRR